MRGELENEGVAFRGISNQYILIMIPAEELEILKRGQEQIIERLSRIEAGVASKDKDNTDYVTAQQFMDAIHIRRWKFDELIAGNKIKTIKKKRKIYVPKSEIARYFIDPSIQ